MGLVGAPRPPLLKKNLRRSRLKSGTIPDSDVLLCALAGHWVIYEAADEVNALLHHMLHANP
jgi:hypothetical protein